MNKSFTIMAMIHYLKKLCQSRWGVILLFALAVLGILWPFLIGGQVIAEKFTPFNEFPIDAFISQTIHSGNSNPLWATGYMSGYSFFIGGFSYLSPFQLPFHLFSFLGTFNFYLFFSLFFAGLFSYLFCRRLGLSRNAAIVGGFVFAFSELSLWWSSILPFAFILPIVPLTFLSGLEISRGRNRYILFATLALATGWYVGFPEQAFYTAAIGGLYAFWLDISNHSWHPIRGFKTSKKFLLAIIASMILALPRILPTIAFIPLSVRKIGVISQLGFVGIGDILAAIQPHLVVPFTDLMPSIMDHEFFMHFGYPVLILFVLGLLNLKRIKFDKNRLFFVGIFIATFLMLIKPTGIYAVFQFLTLHLFRGPWKLLFLGGFGLAIISATFFDHLPQIKHQKITLRAVTILRWTVSAVTIILIGANVFYRLFREQLLSYAQNYFQTHIFGLSGNQPLDYYLPLIGKTIDNVFGYFSWSSLAFMAMVVMSLILVWTIHYWIKEKITNKTFSNIVVLIFIIYPVLVYQNYYLSVPKTALLTPPQSARFINDHNPSGDRIFRFWPGYSAYNHMGLDQFDSQAKFELNKEMMQPSINLIYNVPSIEGDENLMSYRNGRVLAHVGSFKTPNNTAERWLYDDVPLSDKLARFQSKQNLNLLSMMNVRYLLSPFELKSPLKKVYEAKITKYNLPMYVYENSSVMPQVYFANQVKFIESDDETALAALKNNPDFSKITLIECEKECSPSGSRNKKDTMEIIQSKAQAIKIKTRNSQPRWLVFSQANLPTWQAGIDGQSTQIYTANYLYQSVYIPVGEHEIIFTYPGIFQQTIFSAKSLFSRLTH